MKKIIFVCTGNTCRSVMAEAVARNILSNMDETHRSEGGFKDLAISSAGIAAFPGMPASAGAIAVMAERGIDIGEHKASRLIPEDVESASLVLTMTREHCDFVRRMVPEAEAKAFTLGEYAGSGVEVPDPYGQSTETYRQSAEVIYDLVLQVLVKLKEG